jgi:hypothetical protein
LKCEYQTRKVISDACVCWRVSILPLSTIFHLDFRTVPTVVFFVFHFVVSFELWCCTVHTVVFDNWKSRLQKVSVNIPCVAVPKDTFLSLTLIPKYSSAFGVVSFMTSWAHSFSPCYWWGPCCSTFKFSVLCCVFFVLFFFVLCLACPMLSVSLECPFLIAHSVVSNVDSSWRNYGYLKKITQNDCTLRVVNQNIFYFNNL